MVEEASTYKTSVNFYWTTRCNDPEDRYLHKLQIFKNKVLKKICRTKKDKAHVESRLSHELLVDLCLSPCTDAVVKSRNLRWTVARTGATWSSYRILGEKTSRKTSIWTIK